MTLETEDIVTTYYRYKCDECGVESFADADLHQAWTDANEDGWASLESQTGGSDICCECGTRDDK